jgi:hypothetical protein
MQIINRKNSLPAIMLAVLLIISACKKKDDGIITDPPMETKDGLYATYAPKMETFTVDATSGGSFISQKGTKVTFKPGSLINASGTPVSGNVTVEFKDIYDKSDMLFADMPTVMGNGMPLKSGGEFFIRIRQDGQDLTAKKENAIVVEQPLMEKDSIPDKDMKPFIWNAKGGAGGGAGWRPSTDSFGFSAGSYVMGLYEFGSPVGDGTWCNSDNPNYFSSYPQTVLTIDPSINPADYNMDVFLVFNNINSMVHVYKDFSGTDNYPYNYAPVGLQATVVAVGSKDGFIYSSFTPITISANQTVSVSLSKTSKADFKNSLTALNN